MNKNIKRIVAMSLVLGTISAVSPVTNVNLLTTKVYAADDENDKTTLESLKLKTSSGSTIKLYDDNDYRDKVDNDDVSDDGTYYAKTSSSKINIDTDGPSSKYVRVFKGTSNSTKGKKISSEIDLSSGTNTLVVRVYSSEPDSSIKYEKDDDVKSEYKIKVKRTGSNSSDSDTEDSSANDYDDIYLDKISVEGESISLSKSKTAYTYNVASDIDKVTIKAVPKDTDDTVTINGNEVNEDDDKYKDDVSLDKGENKIKIKVEDDDNNDREYTLNITRGSNSSTSTSTTKTETVATATATTTPSTATDVVNKTVKANQWVQVSGKWQYNDSTGNPVKNMWVQNYYVQADGNMVTGWLSNGGSWYYLGTDGAKKTGWKSVGGAWYYLDGEGKMQTGWMKDITGKYYYLNSNGSMASNTTIGTYKLGTDGAWIGK